MGKGGGGGSAAPSAAAPLLTRALPVLAGSFLPVTDGPEEAFLSLEDVLLAMEVVEARTAFEEVPGDGT